jgi:shikimate kinase
MPAAARSNPAPTGAVSIALVGLPGSGKTTVGRQLARLLGLSFVDSDQAIEQRLGVPIREYFARHGEAAFRDVESAVIDELAGRPAQVLATGGGSVLRPSNRDALHSRSHVVYLHATPDALARRLRHDTQRPLLQVADPLQRLRELHEQRDPLYRRTAHVVVDSAHPSVRHLASLVRSRLEHAGAIAAPDPSAEPAPSAPPDPVDGGR